MRGICVDVGVLLPSPLRRFNVEQITECWDISVNCFSIQLALDDPLIELQTTLEWPESRHAIFIVEQFGPLNEELTISHDKKHIFNTAENALVQNWGV